MCHTAQRSKAEGLSELEEETEGTWEGMVRGLSSQVTLNLNNKAVGQHGEGRKERSEGGDPESLGPIL